VHIKKGGGNAVFQGGRFLQHTRLNSFFPTLLFFLSIFILSACGGSSDNGATETTTPPTSAEAGLTLTGYDDSGPGDRIAGLKVTCNSVAGWEYSVEVVDAGGGTVYSGGCTSDGVSLAGIDPYMSYTISLYQRVAASASARSTALEGDGWELVESRTVPSALSGCSVRSGNHSNTVSCTDRRDETEYRACFSQSPFTLPTDAGVACVDFSIKPGARIKWSHTGLSNGEKWYYSVGVRSADGSSTSLPTSSGQTTSGTPNPTGCTDISADNYDSGAVIDDGSCAFTVASDGGSSSGGGSTTATSMVTFAGGGFTMGWSGGNADSPEHTVTLSGFSIEKKEVNQTQFQAVSGSNPSNNVGGALPVEQVTWQEATDYCAAIGRRLPTEAEWEYSARDGGTEATSAYANGSTTLPPQCVAGTVATPGANYSNCNGATIAVGSYSASGSGLYDMAGNVWEWTGDWYGSGYYANGQVDPTGPASGMVRVMRGGSWGVIYVLLRASNRNNFTPSFRSVVIGFRCAQ